MISSEPRKYIHIYIYTCVHIYIYVCEGLCLSSLHLPVDTDLFVIYVDIPSSASFFRCQFDGFLRIATGKVED